MSSTDTIAAIATAPGRGGIGVVRVSGPAVPQIIDGVIGDELTARVASLAAFRGGAGDIIDRGIALYYPGSRSYTGEPVLELQGHGGPLVLQMLLARCLELGARVAEPGEFTRRAYLNDKLDLAQAESVADLIDANTASAARSAMRSLQGEFSARINAVAGRLVDLRVLVEATLDFPEEDIDAVTRTEVKRRLADVQRELVAVHEAARQGSLLREGVRVVLAGEPNVGKSSLLNRLAGEELAIVTEIPGTTRDTVHQTLSLEGVPVHVIDTAGLRETVDPVEQAGIARTWAAVNGADLVLVIQDARGARETDSEWIARLPPGLPRITVANKVDLTPLPPGRVEVKAGALIRVSAKTGSGVHALRSAILEAVGWHHAEEGLYLARARHLEALEEAGLRMAGAAAGKLPELVAEELRLAHLALGRITGHLSADDLLGEIFSRFCIGK